MRFQLLDIVPYRPDPVTGRQVSPADRFAETVEQAVRAEEWGRDATGIDPGALPA